MHLRNSRSVTRETHQPYRGKPLLIEIGPDGVFLRPKGTRQRVRLNLEAVYQRALANGAPPLPTGRQMGLSARKPRAEAIIALRRITNDGLREIREALSDAAVVSGLEADFDPRDDYRK